MKGARRRGGYGATGWLRIAWRLVALIGWLLACLPGALLARGMGHSYRAGTSRWPRRFLAGVGRIVGLRLVVRGAQPAGRRLIIANHVSWLDVPVLAGTSGSAFVAHDGLANVPLLRWLCRLAETIFVARHDPRSVAEQIARVREGLGSGGTLTIFAEGTTSNGRDLRPFKSSLLSAFDGAADPALAALAVQPVWLDYGDATDDIAWLGTEHGLVNFLRVCARVGRFTVTVHMLAPLSGAALAGRKAMAQAARAAIVAEIEGGGAV